MTLQPNLDQINSPAEFVEALNQARVWAGSPSFRGLERRSGHEYSHGTFRRVLLGPGLPKMWQMLALISALGLKDDDCMWATAWRRIALGKTRHTQPEETATPPSLVAYPPVEKDDLPQFRGSERQLGAAVEIREM